MSGDTFDYIIVGGGTAGLVLASRLSEDPEMHVLCVEAGDDNHQDPLVLGPNMMGQMYGNPKYDWNFNSTPQASLHGRRVVQPRGRMLGGSSALNFLLMVYPSKRHLDLWADALGNPGWDWATLEPYFAKTATIHAPPESATEVIPTLSEHKHDSRFGGPVQVSFSEGYSQATNGKWMSAFDACLNGIRTSGDPRSGEGVLGAFQQAATIDPATKTRSFAATAYYGDDIRTRPNLAVWTDSLVEKILFDEKADENGDVTAIGVVVLSADGTRNTVHAAREIILAAGALQSPQILELSGIGDRALLEQHGIRVVVENANVGEHMGDHPCVGLSCEVHDGVASSDVMRDPAILNAVLQMYIADGSGPFGQSNISSAHVPLVDGTGPLTAEARDKLLHDYLGPTVRDQVKNEHPFAASDKDAAILRDILSEGSQSVLQYILFPGQSSVPHTCVSTADMLAPIKPENYLTIFFWLNHPLSRGSCHIASPSVVDKPIWDPQYNSEGIDLEILARGAQFAERLVRSAEFSSVFKQGEGAKRIPDGCEGAQTDLEQAREIVRRHQISIFHPSGSLRMRPQQDGGVVDTRLRVYGTRNLRVCDASVFPMEPPGNLQSIVYAVAERAADLIKEDRGGLRL